MITAIRPESHVPNSPNGHTFVLAPIWPVRGDLTELEKEQTLGQVLLGLTFLIYKKLTPPAPSALLSLSGEATGMG